MKYLTIDLGLIKRAECNRDVPVIRILEIFNSTIKEFKFFRCGKPLLEGTAKFDIKKNQKEYDYLFQTSFEVHFQKTNETWSFRNVPYDCINVSKTGISVFEKERELEFEKI